MYYVRWNRAMTWCGLQAPYLMPCTVFEPPCPWGRLEKAQAFASQGEAKKFITNLKASHWFDLTTIIFIHPFNLEELKKKDV